MQRTDIQFVSFLTSSANPTLASQSSHLRLPFILDRLDDEAQRGTDFVDIFIHNLLHNSSFPSIVKAPSPVSCFSHRRLRQLPYSIKMRISLSLRRAFLSIDSIFGNP